MQELKYMGQAVRSEYLYHFGVKGQSWYERNYQDYDTKPTRSGKIGIFNGKRREIKRIGKDYATTEAHGRTAEAKATRAVKIENLDKFNKNLRKYYRFGYEGDHGIDSEKNAAKAKKYLEKAKKYMYNEHSLEKVSSGERTITPTEYSNYSRNKKLQGNWNGSVIGGSIGATIGSATLGTSIRDAVAKMFGVGSMPAYMPGIFGMLGGGAVGGAIGTFVGRKTAQAVKKKEFASYRKQVESYKKMYDKYSKTALEEARKKMTEAMKKENTKKEDTLKHYNINGSKWYVRRFQSYSVKPTRSGKVGVETGEAAEQASRVGDLTDTNDVTPEMNEKLSDYKFVSKHINEMPNEELEYAIKRMDLQKRINDFKPSKIRRFLRAYKENVSTFNESMKAVTNTQVAANNFTKMFKHD